VLCCLYCIVIVVLLYCYIAALLYCCIVVLLYCCIVVLLYCCIVVLLLLLLMCVCVCVCVCKVWEKRIFAGEWKGPTAGGCCNHKTWNQNPQVRLHTHTHTHTHPPSVLTALSPVSSIGCVCFSPLKCFSTWRVAMNDPTVSRDTRRRWACTFSAVSKCLDVIRRY
jgi:hypothetical protein